MPEKFETLESRKTSAEHLKTTAHRLRGVPRALTIDSTRGQLVEVSGRQWTFLMTSEAAEGWEQMGREPLVLGLLAYHALDVEDPFLHRMLVVLPGRRGALTIEMRDSEGSVLWEGTAEREGEVLHFSMPITRPRSDAKGKVAGQITRKGKIQFEVANLPRPLNKKTPTYESED